MVAEGVAERLLTLQQSGSREGAGREGGREEMDGDKIYSYKVPI